MSNNYKPFLLKSAYFTSMAKEKHNAEDTQESISDIKHFQD